MKTKLFVACIIMFFYLNVFSQVTQEWINRYNGPNNGNDRPRSMVMDKSGNLYVAGHSSGIGSGLDYVTIKYNSIGQQQWVARYYGFGNGSDDASALAVDNLGNVYVTGRSTGNNTGGDFATVKYNSSGVEEWAVRYTSTGNHDDYAVSLKVDKQGNIYVLGSTYSGAYNYQITTIKYNSSGIQQWIANFFHSDIVINPDYASDLQIDNIGNSYVTGFSGRDNDHFVYVTLKYNSSGVRQWFSNYSGNGSNSFDYPTSIGVDTILGKVFVTGFSKGSSTNYDYATVKYNSSGVQEWATRYNAPANGDDKATFIKVEDPAYVYVTGYSFSTSSYDDFVTIKYNESGVQQWVSRYGEPGLYDDEAYSITSDRVGNFYITGSSYGPTSTNYKIVKFNSSGVQQWAQEYNGEVNGEDYGISAIADSIGNIFITGSSTGIGTNVDVVTLKYSQNVGITQISTSIPDKHLLMQNYPNPFNPITTINFLIPKNTFVKIKVFDIRGKDICTLVNENLNAGSYKVDFDGSNYPSGIYYYEIKTDNFRETKKMIFLK